MSASASPVSRTPTQPRDQSDHGLKVQGLLAQFAVAECRSCDTIMLLGETAPGDLGVLCPSCRALPVAPSRRPPLPAQSGLLLDLGTLHDERRLDSRAA
jgi:hypothetical protein